MDTAPHISKTPSKLPSLNEENLKRLLKTVHSLYPHFKHEAHSPVVNVNEVADERLTFGQKVADMVVAGIGSWKFIISQTVFLAIWATLNAVGWFPWKWDFYPYIAMNLLLSCQAAYASPLIMMSQNRQSAKDRLTAENDYKTDVKGEEEICHIMEHLDHQDALILQVVQHLEAQNQRIDQQEQLILTITKKLEEQNKLLEEQHLRMLQALGTQDNSKA
jgi:uncharacterized membrane protein